MRVFETDGRVLLGVGGIGTGSFFALEGNHTLGRNESRPGQLLEIRDYCKLHIVAHYIARLLGAGTGTGEKAIHVLPIGKVGDDPPGQLLRRQMQTVGMDTRFVTAVPGKPTLSSVCFQYPDGSGGNITTSNSAAAEICNQDVDDALRETGADGGQMIALAVPEVPLAVRHHLLTSARRKGAFCAASFVSAEIAAAKQKEMFGELDLVALNEAEAAEFVGVPFSDANPEAFVAECLSLLGSRYPNLRLVVSVGKRGAYGFEHGNWNVCPAPQVPVSSTAGAGDALLAGVISAIAAGVGFTVEREKDCPPENAIATALEFGVMLASYTVTSPHTIHPDACLDALLEFAEGLGKKFAPEILDCLADVVPDANMVSSPAGTAL
jgi:sugar/nucleoside kinase (ribokinase family)